MQFSSCDIDIVFVFCFQSAQQTKAAYADTHLESMCNLDINSKPAHYRMSGIICTIGKLEHIEALVPF